MEIPNSQETEQLSNREKEAAERIKKARLLASDLDHTLIAPKPGDHEARILGTLLGIRGIPVPAEDMVAAASTISIDSLHPALDLLSNNEYGEKIHDNLKRAYPNLKPEAVLALVDQWILYESINRKGMGAVQEQLGLSPDTQQLYRQIREYGRNLRRPPSQYMITLPGAKEFIAYGLSRVDEGSLPGGFILLTNSEEERVNRQSELIKINGRTFPHLVSATNGTVSRFDPLTGKYEQDPFYMFLRPHEIKPHPQAHLGMLEVMGIKPEDAVYFGDSLDDVSSSTTAGMACILINNRIQLPAKYASNPRVWQFPSLSRAMALLGPTSA